MSTKLLRIEANERMDLEDFSFAVDEALQRNADHLGAEFLASSLRVDRSWVLSGFVPDSPINTQVRVVAGRALLARREGGQIFFGGLASEGDGQRIIDISGYGAATYEIFVRFEWLSGEVESRAFWDPTGSGQEIAQTIPTRRLGNWSLRIELATPGAEWLRIGTVVIAAGVVTSLTDTRPLYFEGTVDGSYASGWSVDGGGVANDRHADRKTYGISDLHTFTAAVRQCLEDLKGRGLRRWWDRDVGGLNVGFDAAPVEDRVAVGDANFFLALVGSAPRIALDATASDYLEYNRSTNVLSFIFGTITSFAVGDTLNLCYRPLNLPSAGLAVGYSGTPVNDAVTAGDADFGLRWTSTNPACWWQYTDGDGQGYNRTANDFWWQIAASEIMKLDATGLYLEGSATKLMVKDTSFGLDFSGSAPTVKFDNGFTDLFYSRSALSFNWRIGAVGVLSLSTGILDVLPGRLRVPEVYGVDPSSPAVAAGDLYTNNATHWLNYYNGTRWQNLTALVYNGATLGSISMLTTEKKLPGYYTVPVHGFRQDALIRVRSRIYVAGLAASETRTIVARLGSYTAMTGATVMSFIYQPTDTDNEYVDIEFFIQNIGGPVINSSVLATGKGLRDSLSIVPGTPKTISDLFGTSIFPIDLTAPLDLFLTIHSTITTGTTVRHDSLIVRID